MPESQQEDSEPQTPPRSTHRRHDHVDITPAASPEIQASPSLSLHSLGMSPFSPWRRQFSAPYTTSVGALESEAANYDDHEVAEDSKDVLIQRLNDLVIRLADDDELNQSTVDFMHMKMDEMERILSQKGGSGGRLRTHRRNQHSFGSSRGDHDIFPASPTPSWLKSNLSDFVSPGIDHAAHPPAEPSQDAPEVKQQQQEHEQKRQSPPRLPSPKPIIKASKHAKQVIMEAQKLHEALEAIIGSLKARQEEQEHIHELLITRVERAAQRIIYLEQRVAELEGERDEGEMEILNLQIQLKAIEVQCLNYVPKDADPELVESIDKWKAEWSALRRKRVLRRGENSTLSGSPATRHSRLAIARSQTTG
ncbi:hypothetical protein BX600DRAFT_124056 [Xylariales sp. PMI_506]|nr:hypothetical protein BX600DRAFT_124056 [Xylariales sp. PMI_506]